MTQTEIAQQAVLDLQRRTREAALKEAIREIGSMPEFSQSAHAAVLYRATRHIEALLRKSL